MEIGAAFPDQRRRARASPRSRDSPSRCYRAGTSRAVALSVLYHVAVDSRQEWVLDHGSSPPARRSLARKIRKSRSFRVQLLALLAARLARPRERARIDLECHPGVPHHKHVVWKVALYAGARLVPYREGGSPDAGGRPRLRLFWPDSLPAASGAGAPPAGWRSGALNARLRDASKRRVQQVFAEVFGYALAVDPTTHVGPCVAKSDRINAAHDGRVVECPLADPDPDLAYERLIDNRADEGTVVDLRVPVLGGEIPFVYLKRRPVGARFANHNIAVSVVPTDEALSAEERDRIGAFCRAMGLDVGELDVLRDAGDGRIYVVDVNRTPWGPPRPGRVADAVRAVRAYAAALARLAERAGAAQGRGDSPPA